MALVVDIAPPRPAPTASFRRIRAASRGFEILFTVLCGLCVALVVFSFWVIFFYQGEISRAVAFDSLLDSGEALACRLLAAFSGAGEAELFTDGGEDEVGVGGEADEVGVPLTEAGAHGAAGAEGHQ